MYHAEMYEMCSYITSDEILKGPFEIKRMRLLRHTEARRSLQIVWSCTLQSPEPSHMNPPIHHRLSVIVFICPVRLFHVLLAAASYLTLCICSMSGSVALSEATKLPKGIFSIRMTVRGSGKKTGPSLMSRTVTWTVAVELGP